jgi:hypothetical protein
MRWSTFECELNYNKILVYKSINFPKKKSQLIFLFFFDRSM